MLTIYPERRKKKSSWETGNAKGFLLAGFRFILPCVIALAVVLLPANAYWEGRLRETIVGKPPVHEKNQRKVAIKDKDAFSSVMVQLPKYRNLIRNRRYLTIIDYSQPSSAKRMYLMDMKTGRVEKFLVSHGKKSGWAYAKAFSNQPESLKSSRGFFVTGKKYCGKHGVSLELYGLEKGVNDNAFRRGIVMHGAKYVSSRSVILNWGRLGRSFGCPAIPPESAESVIERIKGGSLIYIHAASNAVPPRDRKVR